MLPKLNHPIHNIEVPSLKKKKNFRPFLVKEEKILLMAKESDDSNDILVAVKQIVNNCSLDPDFNIDEDIRDYGFIGLNIEKGMLLESISDNTYEGLGLEEYVLDFPTLAEIKEGKRRADYNDVYYSDQSFKNGFGESSIRFEEFGFF